MGRRATPWPDSIVQRSSRRRLFRLLQASLVAGAFVCGRVSAPTAPPVPSGDQERYHNRTFSVVRVVDGDTLDIGVPDGDKDRTRIRLWGVDTPEVARGRGEGMHFGSEASAFAKRTLEGKDVHIVLSPRRTRGKYGRLLAYVFMERGGAMFNEMLLEGGYAYADLRFPHDYADRFRAIEKQSRRTKVGLWKDVTLETMPKWKQRYERK